MTGTVSFFDKRARMARRDALVESIFQDLRALAAVMETEDELKATLLAQQAVKGLRRQEVVTAMDQARLLRGVGP